MPLPPAPQPTLLAFDTSTERMAVALRHAGQRLAEDLPGGAAASATLLPALHALLQRAGASMGDVAAVAFGRGPGAFTGLRTSCAVAQGLAFGLGCPVLPIDSLLVVAEQARRLAQPAGDWELAVVMDARMGEAYAATARWQAGAATGGCWQLIQPPGLWAPGELGAAWAAWPRPSAGSGLDLFDAELAVACPRERRIAVGDDRAAALLALAEQALGAGQGLPAEQALPLYLRDKVALTTAEREAARAAAATAP